MSSEALILKRDAVGGRHRSFGLANRVGSRVLAKEAEQAEVRSAGWAIPRGVTSSRFPT